MVIRMRPKDVLSGLGRIAPDADDTAVRRGTALDKLEVWEHLSRPSSPICFLASCRENRSTAVAIFPTVYGRGEGLRLYVAVRV